MKHIFIYGDSLTWGVIPGTRRRLPFEQRWPGVLEMQLNAAGQSVRIIEDCLNGRRTVLEDPMRHGRNGLAGIVRAMRAAPIEPGMPVPPILIVAPPPITAPVGDNVDKFPGAEKKCIGLAAAFRTVAETEGCAFFDAGSVARLSATDGIHMDAGQQEALGRALTGKVTEILSKNAAPLQI
jgi:lysophospholipase L1-like esterase